MVSMESLGDSQASHPRPKEQVAGPATKPFPNTSVPGEHAANTFTAPLGNIRSVQGLCERLWWQVTLAEGGTACMGALPGHMG